MVSQTEQSHIEKLEEFVNDEEKIVTCFTISDALNIPLQDAKSLISKFIKTQKPSTFACTYLISGSLEENSSLAISFVKECDLQKTRKLFTENSSEFIYSIQKNKNIDYNLIVLQENQLNLENHPFPGAVVGKNCIKEEVPVEDVPIPAKKSPAKKEIKSFFNNIQQKDAKEEIKSTIVGTKNQSNTKNGRISSFFNKTPMKIVKKEAEIKEESNISSKCSTNDQNTGLIENKENKEEEMEVDVNIGTKEEDKSSVTKRKRKNKNIKNDSQIKKRKRIQEICDSDSSDLFGSEPEDNDIIDESEDERASVEVVKPIAPKRKVKKAVDKFFKDDDGYLVTQIEYIYESASEEESSKETKAKVEIKPKLEIKIEQKKNSTTDSENDIRKQTTTKGKKNKKGAVINQPTLMNFFKKK